MAIQTEVWVPVATLLLGYILNPINDLLRDSRASKRERAARDAQKQSLAAERHDLFQRQTLLDLQDSLAQSARAAGASHVEDVTAYRTTGRWQKQPLPADLDNNFRVSQVQTSLLAARVADDDIRHQVKEFRSRVTAVALSLDEPSSDHALRAVVELLEDLNERIGQRLRSIDASQV